MMTTTLHQTYTARPIRVFTAVLVLLLSLPLIATHADAEDSRLVAMLREGGFNIYFRHAQTNWSQADRIVTIDDTESCDGERVRQLSDEGRRTSSGVGDAIRALGIPVGRVVASPYCRTMDTARQMNVGKVEASNDVMNLRAAGFVGGRDAVIARARALLATKPASGTNTLIVAHGNVAQTATPVYPGEAEGVVFRPNGDGEFELIARISPARWSALAEAFGE